MNSQKNSSYRAFTLAELLIALVILGVIATFTIPKVLTTQQNSQRTAVFREVIASLYQVAEAGVLEGVFTPTSQDSDQGPYFLDKLNFVKLCSTDSLAQGCWDAAQGDIDYDDAEMGGVMHNGAAIVGLGNSGGNIGRESVTIDWNGIDGPNLFGDDQMRIDICFGIADNICQIPSPYLKTNYPSYQIGPFSGASATLWEQVFAD